MYSIWELSRINNEENIMSKRVNIDVFSTIAFKHYGRLKLTRPEIRALPEISGALVPAEAWEHKVKHGVFKLVGKVDKSFKNIKDFKFTNPKDRVAVVTMKDRDKELSHENTQHNIPEKNPNFIPWGTYSEITAIVKSGLFYPTYIVGEAGNGKTTQVIQACANLDREVYRVNFTHKTTDEDLLGSYVQPDGIPVWKDGAVVEAMKAGELCILDELNLANQNSITCLNSILEGNPVFIKNTGEYVYPKLGFNIIATSNIKGALKDVGSQNNDGCLDKFSVVLKQPHTNKEIEHKILTTFFKSIEPTVTAGDKEFINMLVKLSDTVRNTYDKGHIDELLSIKRLLDMSKTYIVFDKDREKAVLYGINRFDNKTKDVLLTLYDKIVANVTAIIQPSEFDDVKKVSTH